MANESRNDKLIEFYAACQSNGYTDMKDKTQSLKAKVIASDLGLNYSRIVALYDEARKATEEKERLDNINGALIFTCYSSSVDYEKEKPTLELYRCDDNTYYCVVEGKRVYGEPFIGTQEAILPETTLREPSTTFYGMSYNGISTGTVSYDPGGETTSMKKTGRGSVYIKFGGEKYIIRTVVPAPNIIDAFKRDEEFRHFYDGKALIFDSIREASFNGDIYGMLKQSYLSLPECGRAGELLRRMIQGRLPSSDQELYDRAMNLGASASSEEVKKAIDTFALISDFKDAKEQKEKAEKRLVEVIQLEKEATIIRKEKGKKSFIIGVVIALIAAVFMYFIGLPRLKMNNAMKLLESGNYDAAYKLLYELDREDIVIASKNEREEEKNAKAYAAAENLFDKKKYDEAIKAFDALGNYRDSAERVKEINEAKKADAYAHAEALYQQGEYLKAYQEFQQLSNYKDARKRISSDEKMLNAVLQAELKQFETVGSIGIFGTYDQDNDISNGEEGIEWIVLEAQDNKRLLVSKYALDEKPYNNTLSNVTWETCSLRTWLNGSFLNNAFSALEQKAILITTVDNSKSQCRDDKSLGGSYSADGGHNTEDQVFLLSYAEAKQCFLKAGRVDNKATKLANAYGNYNTSWWLRSPGFSQDYASIVNDIGSQMYNQHVDISEAVRPCIWIDINTTW